MTKALDQIAEITEALKRISLFAQDTGTSLAGLVAKLDKLTLEHTAFFTFSGMIHAGGNYRPSIRKKHTHINDTESYRLPCGRVLTAAQLYAELDLLALCYDMAQEARGDSRRAFRS